jgi:hypothetical protein
MINFMILSDRIILKDYHCCHSTLGYCVISFTYSQSEIRCDIETTTCVLLKLYLISAVMTIYGKDLTCQTEHCYLKC